MYPTDVVKTRAQLSVGKQRIGLVKALTDLAKNEGYSNAFNTLGLKRCRRFKMYRGILPPILVEAPKRAVKFAANETYKPYFIGKDGKLSKRYVKEPCVLNDLILAQWCSNVWSSCWYYRSFRRGAFRVSQNQVARQSKCMSFNSLTYA